MMALGFTLFGFLDRVGFGGQAEDGRLKVEFLKVVLMRGEGEGGCRGH